MVGGAGLGERWMECRHESYLSYIYTQIVSLGTVLTIDNIIEVQHIFLLKRRVMMFDHKKLIIIKKSEW